MHNYCAVAPTTNGSGQRVHLSQPELDLAAVSERSRWRRLPSKPRRGVPRVLTFEVARGVSLCYGAPLAEALEARESWAEAMLGDLLRG